MFGLSSPQPCTLSNSWPFPLGPVVILPSLDLRNVFRPVPLVNAHFLTWLLWCLFVRLYVRSFIHSSIHLFTHSFIHACMHSFIHPSIHSFKPVITGPGGRAAATRPQAGGH